MTDAERIFCIREKIPGSVLAYDVSWLITRLTSETARADAAEAALCDAIERAAVIASGYDTMPAREQSLHFAGHVIADAIRQHFALPAPKPKDAAR